MRTSQGSCPPKLIKTAENIAKILEDERIIKDTMTVAKLQEMKQFLAEITL